MRTVICEFPLDNPMRSIKYTSENVKAFDYVALVQNFPFSSSLSCKREYEK